jgi:hypothetical protein
MQKSKAKKYMQEYLENLKRLMYWVDQVEGYIEDAEIKIIECEILSSTMCELTLDKKPEFYMGDLQEFAGYDHCWVKANKYNDGLAVRLSWRSGENR